MDRASTSLLALASVALSSVCGLLAPLATGGCQTPPQAVEQAPDASTVDARAPVGDSSIADAAIADSGPSEPDSGVTDASHSTADAEPPAMYCGPHAGESCGPCGTITCSGSAINLVCENNGPSCSLFEFSTTTEWPAGSSPMTLFSGGLAFGDIDGDQHVDAAVSGPDRLRVYRGDGLGGFSYVSDALVGGGPGAVRAVTLVDYDGDGDLDISMSAEQPSPAMYLFANDGTGRFLNESSKLGAVDVQWPGGPAWADYDNDGYLDAFVPAFAGYPSRLFHNLGALGFEEVGAVMGVANPAGPSLQGVWLDYDNDGDQDLLVSNDRGNATGINSVLYRNDGASQFTDVSTAAGITALVDAMGIAIGDIDNDGDFDIYITDIGWVVPEGQLLYLNQGDGTFVPGQHQWRADVENYYGWGAEFLDFDNDGDLDLAMASAFPQQPWLGVNLGARFLDITPTLSSYPQGRQYGLASADFDGDGRLDLGWRLRNTDSMGDPGVLAHFTRNTAPTTGHWLRVALDGRAPNTRAIGAVIRVRTGLITRTRQISAGNSFHSSSEPIAHFGLGASPTVDAIEVRWPNGALATYPGPISGNQTITLAPP